MGRENRSGLWAERKRIVNAEADILASLAEQELYVLSLLHTHRKAAEPIVAAARLEMKHFTQDDLRLVFAGWLVACEEDLSKLQILKLIRAALREAGFWNPEAGACEKGFSWSDARLAKLASAAATDEEISDIVSGEPQGLERAIARNVVALVESAEAMEVWNL